MNTHGVRILSPGPLTTVQDLGRPGFQRFGVPVGGAMDSTALIIGNRLVGNDRNAASLEITLGGASLIFDGPSLFVITGADLGATLNSLEVPLWETYCANDGDILEFVVPITGLRSYVCIAGGIATQRQLGSRSTHVASGLGGLDGRSLRNGDYLPIGPVVHSNESGLRLPDHLRPRYEHEITARVLFGPQGDAFSQAGVDTFFNSEYTVTERSDRQGIRLEGPNIEALNGRYDIVSDAVPLGSIQVPGDGKPIVLLADRQTTGGYAKIGVVASADLHLMAQANPGCKVRFQPIDIAEAQVATLDMLNVTHHSRFESRYSLVDYSLKVGERSVKVAVPRERLNYLSRVMVRVDDCETMVGIESIDPR